MMRLPVSSLTLWTVAMLLLAGCGGVAPPPGIYLLGNPPNATAGVAPQSGRPVMQILPVSVPDYLDTRDILIRNGRNEVIASPNGRWGERVSVGVTHALTTALVVRLPGTDVTSARPATTPAREVQVDVEAFEIEADGRCVLTARWTVASGSGRRVLRTERGTFIEPAGSTGNAAVAAAMTRAIDSLADQIARNEGMADGSKAQVSRASGAPRSKVPRAKRAR